MSKYNKLKKFAAKMALGVVGAGIMMSHSGVAHAEDMSPKDSGKKVSVEAAQNLGGLLTQAVSIFNFDPDTMRMDKDGSVSMKGIYGSHELTAQLNSSGNKLKFKMEDTGGKPPVGKWTVKNYEIDFDGAGNMLSRGDITYGRTNDQRSLIAGSPDMKSLNKGLRVLGGLMRGAQSTLDNTNKGTNVSKGSTVKQSLTPKM